jgi:hypothetical protein
VSLRNVLITAIAAGSSLIGAATAVADPAPAPAVPNVAAYAPVNPADYTVNGGKWYAFAGPAGVVCVLDALKGDYGCAGLLPGAPEGVTLVSAGPSGVPAFTSTGASSPYAAAGPVKPLPPKTRLSFRSTFCGVDADGVVACLNTREGVGFVVAPEYTSIIAPPPPPPPTEPAPEVVPAPDEPASPAPPQ